MLGLKPLGKPYLGAYYPTHDTHNCSFYHEKMECESWYVYPEYNSDWNWLMEAVEFVQKQPLADISCDIWNMLLRTPKKEIFVAVSDFAKLYNSSK